MSRPRLRALATRDVRCTALQRARVAPETLPRDARRGGDPPTQRSAAAYAPTRRKALKWRRMRGVHTARLLLEAPAINVLAARGLLFGAGSAFACTELLRRPRQALGASLGAVVQADLGQADFGFVLVPWALVDGVAAFCLDEHVRETLRGAARNERIQRRIALRLSSRSLSLPYVERSASGFFPRVVASRVLARNPQTHHKLLEEREERDTL